MQLIFSKVLNMSLGAGLVIIVVMFLRLLLKRMPKKYAYLLWLVVFFRLICPLKIESPIGMVLIKENIILYEQNTNEIVSQQENMEQSGKESISTQKGENEKEEQSGKESEARGEKEKGEVSGKENVNTQKGKNEKEEQSGKESATRGEKEKIEIFIADKVVKFLKEVWGYLPTLWIIGIVILGGCGLCSFFILKHRLRTAVMIKKDFLSEEDAVIKWHYFQKNKQKCLIYESGEIDTAFLLGFVKPCIYLPVGIGEEREYVIAHELMHKRRLDYLVKPVCYFAVILHWFNPLVWLSFRLMVKDMEMACDEQVLKEAIGDIRGEYSKSLLNLSVKRSGFAMPLGFGESDTKERIYNILRYKKASARIVAGAVIILFIAVILLIPNTPKGENIFQNLSWEELSVSENEQTDVFFQKLCENRNQYIGNNSLDGKLLSFLPELNSYQYSGMSLQTQKKPFGMTIVYEKTDPINVKEEFQNTDTMIRNAIFLFAIIENMDVCNVVLVDDAEEFWQREGEQRKEVSGEDISEENTFEIDRRSYTRESIEEQGKEVSGGDISEENTFEIDRRSYTREDMENLFGALYVQSETPEGLRALNEEYVRYKEKMEKLAKSEVEVIEPDVAKRGWADFKKDIENDGKVEKDLKNTDMSLKIHQLISQAILNYIEEKNGVTQEYIEAHRILGGEEAVFQELLKSNGVMEFYVLVQYAVAGNTTDVVWKNQKIVDTQGENTIYSGNGATTQLKPQGYNFWVKVTISIAEDGSYKLEQFWVPKGKDLLEEDIKKVFPEKYQEMVSDIEGYKSELAEELLKKGWKKLKEVERNN